MGIKMCDKMLTGLLARPSGSLIATRSEKVRQKLLLNNAYLADVPISRTQELWIVSAADSHRLAAKMKIRKNCWCCPSREPLNNKGKGDLI